MYRRVYSVHVQWLAITWQHKPWRKCLQTFLRHSNYTYIELMHRHCRKYLYHPLLWLFLYKILISSRWNRRRRHRINHASTITARERRDAVNWTNNDGVCLKTNRASSTSTSAVTHALASFCIGHGIMSSDANMAISEAIRWVDRLTTVTVVCVFFKLDTAIGPPHSEFEPYR